MEAEKIAEIHMAFHSVLLWCRMYSVPLWSFDLILSKLMPAANSVQFCLNPFCPQVNKVCLPHNKNNSDKTVHNLQLASAGLEVERPERSTTFSSFAILCDKSTEWKPFGF